MAARMMTVWLDPPPPFEGGGGGGGGAPPAALEAASAYVRMDRVLGTWRGLMARGACLCLSAGSCPSGCHGETRDNSRQDRREKTDGGSAAELSGGADGGGAEHDCYASVIDEELGNVLLVSIYLGM